MKPLTLKLKQKITYRIDMSFLSDAYKYTSKVMASNALGEDAKEGIGSFLEKRIPNWEK